VGGNKSKLLQNVDYISPDYTASHSRKLSLTVFFIVKLSVLHSGRALFPRNIIFLFLVLRDNSAEFVGRMSIIYATSMLTLI
jgi:hypothetical protein